MMRRGCRVSSTLQQLLCRQSRGLWSVRRGTASSWAAATKSLSGSRRGLVGLAEASSSSLEKSSAAAAVDSDEAAEDSPFSSTYSASFDALRTMETRKPQRTLRRPVTRAGVGLHSGEVAELRLLPAAAGNGRYFVVGNENFRIPAMLDYVRDTLLNTCLGRGNLSIRTVEHLLSALEGLGVDNCRIEIRNGREVPVLDGSALEWVKAIEHSGLSVAEDGEGSRILRRKIVLTEPLSVWHGDSFVAGFPASNTRLTYGIDFSQVQAIRQQWFTWSPDDTSSYSKEVAPARTFGIYEQINQLQAAGLIKGGSLENALVCSMENGWLNPPLRFSNEPCRHKLLDLIGDLALCAYKGHPGLPVAHIIAYKASHALHVKFGEAVLQAGVKQLLSM
ncbi:unnamed protein product [Calypogeia fissa]